MTRKIILQNYPHYVGVSKTSIEIAYDCSLLQIKFIDFY